MNIKTSIVKRLLLSIPLSASVVGTVGVSTQVSADQAIFRNANDIPPPQKGANGYIALPQNATPPTPQLPTGMNVGGNQRTAISQEPNTTLTRPSYVTPAPITLDAATLKQQTVVIDNDDTHVVPVSQGNINRINTPFRNPIVLVNGGARYKVVGQDVYLIMESDQPIGIFVREDDNLANNSPVASLTLVPKAIATQNITLTLESSLKDRLSNPNGKIPTDYTDVLRSTMAAVAQGKLPDGYSRSNVSGKAIARIGAVVLRPKTIYSGVENNVFVYVAQNVSSNYVELSEPSFWHKGVRAVSFNGDIKLAPSKSTEVIIIADTGNGDESVYD